MKKKTSKRCWKCKSGPLRKVFLPMTHEVAGQTFRARVKWEECANCGEQTIHQSDFGAFELAVAQALARSGASSGEALKFMRKAIGLRAVDLAELLELRPETISRMETSKEPADRRTAALLAGLIEDAAAGTTATRDRLETLCKPKRHTGVVQVDVRRKAAG